MARGAFGLLFIPVVQLARRQILALLIQVQILAGMRQKRVVSEYATRIDCRYSTRREGGALPVGNFHEIAGDLTREQLNSDMYWCGVDVGRAARERYPSLSPDWLAETVGVRVCEYSRGGRTIPRVWRSGGGSLFYGRTGRRFLIEYESGLVGADRSRVVALLLGVSFVALHSDGGVRVGVREERFAQGFADGMLGQSYYEAREIDDARVMSAVVRSRVKDALFGEGAAASRAHGADADLSDGLNPLVAGSTGSGKSVMLTDYAPVKRLASRPDMVLSTNGRTVKVYNRDGVPLSTNVDGNSVFLVNEATGERMRVPAHASHMFFVEGDVWFHYPNWGEPDLVFDDGWVGRNMTPRCSCCGAPVDVDGEMCDACEGRLPPGWWSA